MDKICNADRELAYAYRVGATAPVALSRQELCALQLKKLNETLAWAQEHSRFYQERFPAQALTSLDEVATLPLMDETAFACGLAPLVCLPQSQLSRIVTVPTSGTTGEPKRIAFTPAEQDDIVQYLASGMRMLAQPEEAIAVLYPCEHEGGLGQLICKGIELAGMYACVYGLPSKERGFEDLAKTCMQKDIKALVGFPQHILALFNWSRYQGIELPVQSVLLSADSVTPSLKKCLEYTHKLNVYAHYGTTEMGYGGAVECACHTGHHIRETELYFEIIDPLSGAPLPEGEWGELVFTTLNRSAMPFIRYRTGDIARIIPEICKCGSILRRIDEVKGRVESALPFTLYEVEDFIFSDKDVLDVSVQWSDRDQLLLLELQKLPGSKDDAKKKSDEISACFGVKTQVLSTFTDDFAPFYPSKRFIKRAQ